jgi:hypothetical protein
MVESVHIERVVTRDQVEQFKLVLLCTLPVTYPPSFYRSITKVSVIFIINGSYRFLDLKLLL